MPTAKVAITLEQDLLTELDQLVAQNVFPNRSKAIQAALQDKLAKHRKTRLSREAAKLDRLEEQRLADEGLESEAWPEY